MAKKADKTASPYDANGRWVEERARIKGAIRRVFRLSPQMKETLTRARVELPPALKKDGTPGARNQVRYRCAVCQGLFPQKYSQVDHISPVVPLHTKEDRMTVDEIARGIFCGLDNLQVICSTPKKLSKDGRPSCHSIKTNEENFIRDVLSEEYLCGKIDMSEVPRRIEALKQEYAAYLADQERLRQEKLQRKLLREQKRLQKQKGKRNDESVQPTTKQRDGV